MNFVTYLLTDGTITSYGVCETMDDVAAMANDEIAVLEVTPEINDTYVIQNGVPILKTS